MRKITQFTTIQSIVDFSNRVTPPGFQGMSIGKVMVFFKTALAKGIIFHRAAAMTYRMFFALIPLLMTLFAAISFLGADVRLTILDFIQSIVPEYVWPAISNMITGVVNNQNGTLLSFSLLFSIGTLVASINASINILNTTYYNIGRRKFPRQLRVISMLILIWFLIILAAVAVFIIASACLSNIDEYVFKSPKLLSTCIVVAKWLLLYLLVYLFISSFYYLAPASHKHFKFFSVGSTFATISMLLVLAVMNFYFSNFGNYNALYGSLGAVFAILMWLYWNNIFILVGYDLNVSIATAKRADIRSSIPPKKK